jgi:hypothetical protein
MHLTRAVEQGVSRWTALEQHPLVWRPLSVGDDGAAYTVLVTVFAITSVVAMALALFAICFALAVA